AWPSLTDSTTARGRGMTRGRGIRMASEGAVCVMAPPSPKSSASLRRPSGNDSAASGEAACFLFDLVVREWIVADEEGHQLGHQAATRISLEDITGLTVTHRDKVT